MRRFKSFGFLSAALLLFGLLDSSCGRKTSVDGVVEKTALVMVVENNGWLGDQTISSYFDLFRPAITEIFADIFGIEQSAMDGMSLTEIIDVYGEAWQINEINTIASRRYERVVALTDDEASFDNFLSHLSALSAEGYRIDVILNLHSTDYNVRFSDGSHDIEEMTGALKNSSIEIRALYQTCCYGSEMIGDWDEYAISAVNGSFKTNSLVMYSPIYFIDLWTQGLPFSDAVQNARTMEIDKIRSYEKDFSLIKMMITDDVLEESGQLLGGVDSTLLWEDF